MSARGLGSATLMAVLCAAGSARAAPQKPDAPTEAKPPEAGTKPATEKKPKGDKKNKKPADKKPESGTKPEDQKPENDAEGAHDTDTPSEKEAVSAPVPTPEPVTPPPEAGKPEPLPDPRKWRQSPPPVPEQDAPLPPAPAVEFGAEAGYVIRPGSTENTVSYTGGWVVGGYARVDLWKFLAARIQARVESSNVHFKDGALGLPPGTIYNEDDLRRVYLSFTLEPQWRPRGDILLWAGLGAGWGRSTVPPLNTTGAFHVALPTRSAVFIEFPISLGARYDVIPRWMSISMSGAFGLATAQSGKLIEPYVTPDGRGKLVTVGAYPDLSISWTFLGGVGILL